MTEREKQALLKQSISNRGKIFGAIGAGVVLLSLVGIIFWRLYQVQVVDGAYYKMLASEQQLKDEPVAAIRGEIYDATGKVLISNNILWDIACDPKSSNGLKKKIEVLDEDTDEMVDVWVLDTDFIATLSDTITRILLAGDGSDGASIDAGSEEYRTKYEAIYNQFSATDSNHRVLQKAVILPVLQAIQDAVRAYNQLDGVAILLKIERNAQRSYPYGTLASSVLGFCNSENSGMYGLEKSYEDILNGTDGRVITIQDAHGSDIANTTGLSYAAQDGSNLVLTLDLNVQKIVEMYLDEAVAANNVENRGACIVMDVNTGSIIAMANSGDFDPNDPYTVHDYESISAMIFEEPELYAKYVIGEDGSYVLDDLGYKVIDESVDYTKTHREIQWKNKNITELYYPGSIFKLFTSASALDAGVATQNTTFECKGSYTVSGVTYHCAGHAHHGVQNMSDAVRNSCNIYFIQLAEKLGSEKFFEYYESFGFTKRTGIDLPYETNYMQYYNEDGLGPVQLASSSFGQAQVMTPIQTCTAVAAVSNGGYLVTPHVVSQIVDANGNITEEIGAQVKRQVISESTSATMRYLMEYEVGYGTTKRGGYRSYVAGYRSGGKSGTSEQLNMDKRVSDGDYKKVSSYVAVLPADEPEYLVFFMLDDPNNPNSDYASALAAPVVGNIISEIAPYLGIPTTGEDLSETTVKVPNLTNLTWSAGQVELNRIGLHHERVESAVADTTAAKITYQYPAPGTEVAGGTTIYTYIEGNTGALTTVPDVVGKTSTFARQIIRAAGLNCDIIGDEDALVSAQSITADESVEKGTIVTIICEDTA